MTFWLTFSILLPSVNPQKCTLFSNTKILRTTCHSFCNFLKLQKPWHLCNTNVDNGGHFFLQTWQIKQSIQHHTTWFAFASVHFDVTYKVCFACTATPSAVGCKWSRFSLTSCVGQEGNSLWYLWLVWTVSGLLAWQNYDKSQAFLRMYWYCHNIFLMQLHCHIIFLSAFSYFGLTLTLPS